MSATDAADVLKNFDVKDDTFLIRYSSTNFDDYTLSVRKEDKIIHLKITFQVNI